MIIKGQIEPWTPKQLLPDKFTVKALWKIFTAKKQGSGQFQKSTVANR